MLIDCYIMVTKVSCPICGQSIVWTDKAVFKPFCSERCKQIDLGNWASGTYTIPLTEESIEISNSEDDII